MKKCIIENNSFLIKNLQCSKTPHSGVKVSKIQNIYTFGLKITYMVYNCFIHVYFRHFFQKFIPPNDAIVPIILGITYIFMGFFVDN